MRVGLGPAQVGKPQGWKFTARLTFPKASVASRTSKASNASGVLLGSCAIPRRRLGSRAPGEWGKGQVYHEGLTDI